MYGYLCKNILLKLNFSFSPPLKESANIIREAVNWMKRKTDILQKPFSLAIVAYAFARVGEYDTARTLLNRGGNFESNISKFDIFLHANRCLLQVPAPHHI